MPGYVALLRGINVGGKNPIRMADLRACFEEAGFANVSTYIQSGNVLFDAPSASARELTGRIEGMLASRFRYDASVVLRSRSQVRAVVAKAPAGFGARPSKFRSDVMFLRAPLTAKTALRDVPIREGVDRAWAGSGVLYFERLTSRASQSRMSKIVALPMYQSMTIRNWSTTLKVLELMEAP